MFRFVQPSVRSARICSVSSFSNVTRKTRIGYKLRRSFSESTNSTVHKVDEGPYEVLLNPIYSSDTQQKPFRWKRWLSGALILFCTSGAVGYVYNRHYNHDPSAFVARSRKQGLFTNTLRFFGILPNKSISSLFEDYSFEMYCERLSHFFYKNNPLRWRNMDEAAKYLCSWVKTDVVLEDPSSPVTEDALYSLLKRFSTLPNRYNVIMMGCEKFLVCPISSTIINGCLLYFYLSMHSRPGADDVELFIPREQVFELIDYLEKRFGVEFYDTYFIPSIYDKLATMKWSFHHTNIRNWDALNQEYIGVYEFIDIIALIASQLQRNNELILALYDKVLELQSSAGKTRITQSRLFWKQREHEKNKQYWTSWIEDRCASLTEEETDNYLLDERIRVARKKWRELWGVDYPNEHTDILREVINEQIEKHNIWYYVSNKA